ncbi:MAG TPA: EAL domain-containing protein, partial [Acidobacteria bacterium]|nr:EAL domain-containing protein [Acidobacteriota bacterium]
RRMGYRFILDDFGSGLSSLEYLRALPVEFLKVDGALISGINDDPVLREIVLAVHRIGQTMHVGTIAESVETEDIYRSVEELGLDYSQGFWTGRPEPFFNCGSQPPESESE